MAKRSEFMSSPGKWEFPGGKVREGELLEDALKRELNEELGIEVVVDAALASASREMEQSALTLYPFLCRLQGREPEAREHEQLLWLAPHEISELPQFLPLDAQLWDENYAVVASYLTRLARLPNDASAANE